MSYEERIAAEEEMDMTLECVSKIRGHLNRLVHEEGKVKYMNNLDLLDTMFVSFQDRQAVAV